MVQFKKQNEVATLESQLTVSPQIAELLKSNEKRIKAFIKDAKIKCEHLVVENTSILGAPITESNATKTISRLEEVHKKLLYMFEKEALIEDAQKKAAAEEQRRKAADEEFGLKKIEEAADVLIDKAKAKNIGMFIIAHDGNTGECNTSGTIPLPIVTAIVLATANKLANEED